MTASGIVAILSAATGIGLLVWWLCVDVVDHDGDDAP